MAGIAGREMGVLRPSILSSLRWSGLGMILLYSQAEAQAGRRNSAAVQAWSKGSETRSWRRLAMDRMALISVRRWVARRCLQLWVRAPGRMGTDGWSDFVPRWKCSAIPFLFLGGLDWSGCVSRSGSGRRQAGESVWLAVLNGYLWGGELEGQELWRWSAGGQIGEREVVRHSFGLVREGMVNHGRFGGSGRVVEPSIWCYSWEQYVIILMLVGYQRKGGFPFHVVWRFMDTVWKRVEWFVWMLVTRLYRDARDWLSFFVAWGDRRKNWLGVEPFRFMDVTISDGPITMDLGRNMCRGVDTTTGYSNAL
ncbi:hypothetical protein RchiOBHm_Chr2g0161601 [Rosa chinensis]|uniref:Uncharacterized protein n=1 Tax=Rosa chinensis TaxID=74649 RepID=A0A2P6S2U7_ROSCH|nr:hypothetical protein RchiOBHm_Chr2g0161601 [Rosa chinensis]